MMPDSLTPKDFETDMFDDEPRIPDWKLAQALGFARVAFLHQLIERHRNTLERVGKLLYRTTVSGSRGPAGRECRLNFKQAIIVVTQSEAPNAIEVLIHVVTIYELWALGKLKPVDAETAQRVNEATIEAQERAPELLSALSELLTSITSQGSRIESVQRTALEIQERLGDIIKRRDAPVRNVDIYDSVLTEFYLDRCPCCQKPNAEIVSDGKHTRDYHLDHWTDNPFKNGLLEMWPVCGWCNRQFHKDPLYRSRKADAFRVFQQHVEEVIGRKLI